jgi:acetyltransferase-like isoleucine patch superfamily enzyme
MIFRKLFRKVNNYQVKIWNDNISILKTLWFNIITKGNRNTKGWIVFCNKTRIVINRTARINLEAGNFVFNKNWVRNEPFRSFLFMDKDSELSVKKTFTIYSGARIYINENATLNLGSGFINNNLNISCFERIEIGEGVAISENVNIRDSDSHKILTKDDYLITQPIKIGNHVWIGMNVTILKGVTIGDGSIVAAGSVVKRDIPPRCLAGGVPARVLTENVEWE